MRSAIQSVLERVADKIGGYVCFSNVHTVVTSRKNLALRQATNDAFLSLPDGRPLSFIGRRAGYHAMEQVAGPDFMPALIAANSGLRHYFYGSTNETLAQLTQCLRRRFDTIQIVGTYSPPFRALSPSEQEAVLADIRASKPDVVWVGLGAPKQECWMAAHWQALKPAVLLGVGAAFDFHAGRVLRAPLWMRRAGLEWLFRLSAEPRRLFRRYLVTNLLFMYYMLKQMKTKK